MGVEAVSRAPAKTYEGNECARCHKTRRYASTRGCVQCAKLAVYKKRGQTAPSSAFESAADGSLTLPLSPAAEAQLDLFAAAGNISTICEQVVPISPTAEAQFADLLGDIE